MLNVHQLRELIIKPALEDLIMLSDDAVELLVFTCAVESGGGTYLKQFKGSALGIYQMEPYTYYDIWINYITKKLDLYAKLNTNFDVNRVPDEYRLIYDLRFATAMARIHYARASEPLPNKYDTIGLWEYYKTYYNSSQSVAQIDQTIQKYVSFINN
jgi:hypothetical protein